MGSPQLAGMTQSMPKLLVPEPSVVLQPPLGTPQSSATGVSDCGSGENLEVLRGEITGLRAEVEALRGMLDGGQHKHDEVKPSRCSALDRCAQLQKGKEVAENQMREAFAEANRLRLELSTCRQRHREAATLPRADGDGEPVVLGLTPQSSWEPPLLCEEDGGEVLDATAPLEEYAGAEEGRHPSMLREQEAAVHESMLHGDSSVEMEAPAADEFPSPGRNHHSSGYLSSPRSPIATDMIDHVDEMWRAVLQRFPQYPHWTLVKEKCGVYRMGTVYGRKIFCRVSRGGLQVRVGGGWMGAVPFLAKYGPIGMGVGPNGEELGNVMYGTGSSEHLRSMMEVPVEMERLLVPTKCWAQRIGICKVPDVREQRRRCGEAG